MTCAQPFSSFDKWKAAIISGLFFALLSSSCFYKWTDAVTQSIGMRTSFNGCPNLAGLFINALLYIIVIRVIMQFGNSANCGSSKDKWVISVIGGILFLIIASPFLYETVNTICSSMGLSTAVDGCPNPAGITIHTILFILMVRILMR